MLQRSSTQQWKTVMKMNHFECFIKPTTVSIMWLHILAIHNLKCISRKFTKNSETYSRQRTCKISTTTWLVHILNLKINWGVRNEEYFFLLQFLNWRRHIYLNLMIIFSYKLTDVCSRLKINSRCFLFFFLFCLTWTEILGKKLKLKVNSVDFL